MNFINRINIKVCRWHAAFLARHATDTHTTATVQTILFHTVFEGPGVNVASHIHGAGTLFRDNIRPCHVQVAAGFHIHFAIRVNAGLFCRGRCVMRLGATTRVYRSGRRNPFTRYGDTHRRSPVLSGIFGMNRILDGGNIQIPCHVDIRGIGLDICPGHGHIAAGFDLHVIGGNSAVGVGG